MVSISVIRIGRHVDDAHITSNTGHSFAWKYAYLSRIAAAAATVR